MSFRITFVIPINNTTMTRQELLNLITALVSEMENYEDCDQFVKNILIEDSLLNRMHLACIYFAWESNIPIRPTNKEEAISFIALYIPSFN